MGADLLLRRLNVVLDNDSSESNVQSHDRDDEQAKSVSFSAEIPCFFVGLRQKSALPTLLTRQVRWTQESCDGPPTESSRRARFCGRDSDGDCRWNQEVIFCHQGTSFTPPEGLKVGDVIDVQGPPGR